MKIILSIVSLILATNTALAQTEQDKLIKSWNVCNKPGLEITGGLATQLKAKGQSVWRTGFENCEIIKDAYMKSKAGIEAKEAADKAAADKAEIDALAKQLQK